MAQRWSDHEIDTMLDYRDQGMTETMIAAKLEIIFMRYFSVWSVNRKIRDLKKQGYIKPNKHTGRYRNENGQKREGEKYQKKTKKQKRLVVP